MFFKALRSGWAVFQKGKAVANPSTWRTYGIAVQAIAAFLAAVVVALEANGYPLPVSDETIQYLASGVAALWFGGLGVWRVISSPERGLSPRTKPGAGEE